MKFLSFLLLVITLQVHAEEIKVAVITSEFDKNVMDFYLITDDKNKIDSMRYVSTLPNGGIDEDVTLPAERVMKEGATIRIVNGFQAVRIEVDNFDLHKGGIFRINYLFNALNGSRQNKRFQLNLINNEYQLLDQGKQINRMFFVVNVNRIFGIVGIKEVKTSFLPEL